jgi:hypothetical protein
MRCYLNTIYIKNYEKINLYDVADSVNLCYYGL